MNKAFSFFLRYAIERVQTSQSFRPLKKPWRFWPWSYLLHHVNSSFVYICWLLNAEWQLADRSCFLPRIDLLVRLKKKGSDIHLYNTRWISVSRKDKTYPRCFATLLKLCLLLVRCVGKCGDTCHQSQSDYNWLVYLDETHLGHLIKAPDVLYTKNGVCRKLSELLKLSNWT